MLISCNLFRFHPIHVYKCCTMCIIVSRSEILYSFNIIQCANSGYYMALDHGPDGTKASMAILKLLCLTLFSDRCCPIHDCSYIIPPLCEHFMESHTLLGSNISPDYITNLIISCTSDSEHFMNLMSLGLSLKMYILPF